MTTLTELIATYVATKKEHESAFDAQWDSRARLATNTRLGNAETALLDYVYVHAAAFAERDRLERNVIAAHRDFEKRINGPYMAGLSALARAQDVLTAWLVAHADNDTPPASDDPAARS